MVEVAEGVSHEPDDLVSYRYHGIGPVAGTDVDALLRNLGVTTVVLVGVSSNVGIPNGVFDLVNLAYEVVVPRDAIAGYPAEYTDVIVDNSISLVATVTTPTTWSPPGRRPGSRGPAPPAAREHPSVEVHMRARGDGCSGTGRYAAPLPPFTGQVGPHGLSGGTTPSAKLDERGISATDADSTKYFGCFFG
jgi:hypothetical protein